MNTSNVAKGFLLFLGGAAVGVAAGVLMAPHKGSVTRRKIIRTANTAKENVKHKIEDVKDSISDLLEDIEDITEAKLR
ncbi:YtxH domain-containing protein [Bacteroidales bacterium OttesenSCG-928-B11]|nr:YtxH domain-containing protein [Bacteroidales bacterium OttesenSCG-928-C03]MDL2312225.1 YtxH domain-containing protein [Bacteroidales bacterium OttesenSCG-928-B11]MDL2326956.1 YtxH domain-containing protein [Bacteroidales bacterium OttesenSCG-928-A14]